MGTELLLGITDDADRAVFSAEAMVEPNSLPSLYSPFVSTREASGWTVHPIGPAPALSSADILGVYAVSSDMSRAAWYSQTPSQHDRSVSVFSVGRLDGTPDSSPLVVSGELQNPAQQGTSVKAYGSSADSSHLVFRPPVNGCCGLTNLFPGEPGGSANLPEAIGLGSGSPSLRMVNRTTSGEQLGASCGAYLGSLTSENNAPGGMAHAVSEDGSLIYFNTVPALGSETVAPCATLESSLGRRVFKRVNGTTTLEVSASQCNRPALPAVPGPCSTAVGNDVFQAASPDGSEMFFSTTRQLTNSDTDSTADLYLYDADPPAGQPTLIQVTAGEAVSGSHPTPGSGANFVRLLDSSADGSRAYFVAEGVLTASAPLSAFKKLYVFERDDSHPTGRIGYVGEVGFLEGDRNSTEHAYALPAHEDSGGGYGDGHIFVFSTTGKAVPQDTDFSEDVYRYDDEAASNKLVCVSCQGSSAVAAELRRRPSAITELGGQYLWGHGVASADGASVVFTTREALLPADENNADDVYEWHEGDLRLISAPTELYGARNPLISDDGKAVFFETSAQLAYADNNTAEDLYSAKVGGGFPDPGQSTSCQSASECHEAPEETPPSSAPSSSSFSGPANPPPAARCAKGKMRRHGKCVKKKHGKKKHGKSHGKRSSGKRGGAK
jgi:hypothetical protein